MQSAQELRGTIPLPTPTPRVRVADALAGVLIDVGVDVVFGIPGGTISPINDALIDRPEIEVFVTRHESEAVFAACGQAMATGGVGVVFTTSGPGLTNALTGLASAKCDAVPLVLLAGEVPRPLQGKGALQDGSTHHLNMLNVARSLAKKVFEVTEPHTAPLRLADALRAAREGVPGPVLVTLPLDVLMAPITPALACFADVSPSVTLDACVLDAVHAQLVDEARPLLFAGSALRRGDGPEKLLAFAERYQLPVVTSPKAKGVFPEDHPLSLGVFGIGGHPSALEYVQAGVGTLIAVGTSLGDLATEGWNPALKPARALIHVDVDPSVISRNYPADIAVVAPATAFFDEMMRRPEPPSRGPVGFKLSTHSDPEVEREGAEGRIAPSRAVWELQRALPDDARFVIDSGEHFLFSAHYLRLSLPDQFIAMTGLGSMGSSLGAAMGAKLAEPARSTCVIMGDGGFTMVGLELLDAVAQRLPIVVAILNDGRLGMCELGHDTVYGRAPRFSVPMPDVRTFAASIGAEGYVVERAGEIESLAEKLQNPKRPILLDIRIDRSVKLPKRDRIGALGQKTSRKPQ